MNRHLLLICILFFSSPLLAVEKIEIQGLFSGKAVVLIDGKRHILAVGQTSPEGIKLVSASSRGAVLEVNGRQKRYQLGNTVSTRFEKRQAKKETIYQNSGGMYLTYGSINGRSVRFLVDTGATAVAMNTEQAKQLGIRYDRIGKPAGISTASGFENGWRVRLKTVTVGNITEKNIEALIIDGNHPGPILLGMSFLGRLNVEHQGNAMTLRQQ